MKRLFRRSTVLLLLLLFLLAGCGSDSVAGERPTEGVGVATVSAVGDIYLTDDMLTDARLPDGSYRFASQFLDVYAALAASDITFGNFEGTFHGAPYGAAAGSYPDELADALKTAGFDLLQTANSYSIFNGLSSLERTMDVLEESGLASVGTYRPDQRDASPVVLYEINGIRIAFVAFTKGLGGMRLPEDAEGCVDLLYRDYTTDYSEINTEHIRAVLREAQEQEADVIIAGLHWGSEDVSTVSEKQEELADYLFENGVDVILGSHSHRVGPVEQRTVRLTDGTEKDVVLAYSLGDFCAAEQGECNASLILNLEFSRDHATGRTTITDVSYTPIAALDRGDGTPDRYAVLDIDNAIALYEGNYYDRISDELYELLLQKRENLLTRLSP